MATVSTDQREDERWEQFWRRIVAEERRRKDRGWRRWIAGAWLVGCFLGGLVGAAVAGGWPW